MRDKLFAVLAALTAAAHRLSFRAQASYHSELFALRWTEPDYVNETYSWLVVQVGLKGRWSLPWFAPKNPVERASSAL